MEVDLQELKLELSIEKELNGQTYTKAKYLADEMEYSSSELGAALAKAEEKGWVEAEFGGATGTTYRITVGE